MLFISNFIISIGAFSTCRHFLSRFAARQLLSTGISSPGFIIISKVLDWYTLLIDENKVTSWVNLEIYSPTKSVIPRPARMWIWRVPTRHSQPLLLVIVMKWSYCYLLINAFHRYDGSRHNAWNDASLLKLLTYAADKAVSIILLSGSQ